MNETANPVPPEPIPSSRSVGIRRILPWLWNPFRHTAGAPALLAGIVIMVATSLLGGLSQTHFDGVLDIHTGLAAPWWFYVAEGLIAWLSLALVLYLAGLIVAGPRRFRAIDLLGTQALARWPLILVTPFCLLPGYTRFSEAALTMAEKGRFDLSGVSAADWVALAVVVFVMILATVWFVALAWKSFRISCGIKGWKAVVAFVVGILLAEIVSKIVLHFGLFRFLQGITPSALP